MTARDVVLSLAVLGACGNNGGSGGGDKGSGAAAPLAKDFRCFDLPGTRRDGLTLLDDGKRVSWRETRYEGEMPISEFVVLDLASGQAKVVEKDTSQAKLVGDQLVFTRATDKTGEWTRWKPRLFVKGAAVSTEGEEVLSLYADPAGAVYYSTYRYDPEAAAGAKVQHTLWKVPAAGGTPTKVRDGFAIYGIAEGGKTLIGAMTREENPPIVKLSAAGGEPVVLAPQSYVFGVVGDKLVFMPRGDKTTLQVVPLAGGTPSPLPGARDSSRLLHGGDQILIIDRTEGDANRVISKTDGVAPLTPLAHLVGVDVSGAVLLPDGATLAALVVHDTNSDGAFDYKDEDDLCLIPTSKAPTAFTPPTRKVPRQLAAAWPQLEGLTTGDLAGAKVRYQFDGGAAAITFEANGDGPATIDEMIARVAKLGAAVTTATADPKIGVVVSWQKNQRLAAALWDASQGKTLSRAGAYGMMVPPRSNFALGAYPLIVDSRDFSKPLPIATVCSGTVTNPGTAPLEVDVECRGWSYDQKTKDDAPAISKKVTVKVPPGTPVKYSIDLGRSKMGYHKSEQRFLVGGKEVPWFNEYAWTEATDYIATADRVLAATGYLPLKMTNGGSGLSLDIEHYGNSGAIAPDFNTLPAERQQQVVKVLWDEWAGHSKRLHGKKPYDVKIEEGSPLGRNIMGGKLQKR